MRIDGRHYRTIWLGEDGRTVRIIDQTRLPHELVVADLLTVEDAAQAIERMLVRGAPLIGCTAAYGVGLAMIEDASDAALEHACQRLRGPRPPAVTLRGALDEMGPGLRNRPRHDRVELAYSLAAGTC